MRLSRTLSLFPSLLLWIVWEVIGLVSEKKNCDAMALRTAIAIVILAGTLTNEALSFTPTLYTLTAAASLCDHWHLVYIRRV